MTTTAPKAPTVALLKLTDVHPDAEQPRKHFDLDELAALAQSIKQHGLIQPITVRKNTKGYVIVAGERRWRASKLAKQANIAAIVTDATDEDALLKGTVENVARADLNVIEEGDAYLRIGGDNPVVANIAKLVSRPEHRVADRMRLAGLPGPVRADVIDGALTLDAARTLVDIAGQPGGDKIAVALAAGVKLNVFRPQTLAQDPARCLLDLERFDPSEVENPCPGCKLTGEGADRYDADRGTGEQIKDGKTWRAATVAEWEDDAAEHTYRNCETCKGEGVLIEHVEGAAWPEFFAAPVGDNVGAIPGSALAQLPEAVRTQINEAESRAEAHNVAMKAKHGYQWYATTPTPKLDREEIEDAAVAAGVAVKLGNRTLITDPAFVAEYLPGVYEDEVAAFEKKTGPRTGTSQASNGSSKSEAEKAAAAKEREKAKKGRTTGRQFNQDLGRAINTKLGEVPVTTDAMKLIVRTLLTEAHGNHYSGSEGHALWHRLTRPDWPTTKDGQPVIPRKSDLRAAFVKQVFAEAEKELAAAKSPEQALAVWVRFLAHGLADATGLPNADLEGMFSYKTEAKSWRAFVLARLPKPIRDRAPKGNGIPGRSYAWDK